MHVGEAGCLNASSMQIHTHKLFSWTARNHRCRESVQSLVWKYPLMLSFSHETPLPSPGLPIHQYTFSTPTHPLAFSAFTELTCILSGKNTLSSFSFSTSVFANISYFLRIHPSIFLSTLQPQYTILHPTRPAPLSLNSFGLRKQTKKGLCPGRKRWCVTQRGDNASAGSTQSQASALGLCLCLSDKLS